MQGCHARHLGLHPEQEGELLLDCKQRSTPLPFALQEGGADSSMPGLERERDQRGTGGIASQRPKWELKGLNPRSKQR